MSSWKGFTLIFLSVVLAAGAGALAGFAPSVDAGIAGVLTGGGRDVVVAGAGAAVVGGLRNITGFSVIAGSGVLMFWAATFLRSRGRDTLPDISLSLVSLTLVSARNVAGF